MMLRYLLPMLIFSVTLLNAGKLTIEADKFTADEKKGVTIFIGHVMAKMDSDEINASKIMIYTDKEHNPKKIIATGDVSFIIATETGDTYAGRAQKAVLRPIEKDYHFFTDVHLKQLNQYKEINGDEVRVNTLKGTALAKGANKRPVIMVFDIADKNETR